MAARENNRFIRQSDRDLVDKQSLNDKVCFLAETPNEIDFRQALTTARLDADYIISQANIVVARAKSDRTLERLCLTENEARVIASYTLDVPRDKGMSVSFALNRVLRGDRSDESFRSIRNLFVMFLRTLRKLPQVRKDEVYCGIELTAGSEIRMDQVITMYGFTSTSYDLNVLNGRRRGTLLVLKGPYIGYDLSPLSVFPMEKELLLEPDTKFRVMETRGSSVQLFAEPFEPAITYVAPFDEGGWPFGTTEKVMGLLGSVMINELHQVMQHVKPFEGIETLIDRYNHREPVVQRASAFSPYNQPTSSQLNPPRQSFSPYQSSSPYSQPARGYNPYGN